MALTAVTFQLVPRQNGSQRISDPSGSEVPPTIGTPTNFRVTENGIEQQTLAWDHNNIGHTGFELETADGPSADYQPTATLGQGDRTYIVRNLPADTLIRHRIRAVNRSE